MSAGSDIAAIAADLLALTPADFTAERNRRAADAPDPELRAAIAGLRRPVVSAWAVDALVRKHPDELSEAVALADELRDAQDDGDARALGDLGRRRRRLVGSLTDLAVAAAEERGVAVSPAAREQIERTLNAGVLDPRAARAILTARLQRPLESAGLDAVDLADAVAGGFDDDVTTEPAPPRDDLAERRARREAEKDARAAAKELSDAEREVVRAERAVDQATERARLLAERVDGLERELARVRADADRADADLERSLAERTAARERAEHAAKDAERAVGRLTDGS